MNITELDNYRLSDAIKFHDRLNPRLWDENEHLRSEVKSKLLEIAADFQEFLGVPELDVKDITVSGSNAAYNYTPNSDIDLHLVVDLPEADSSEVFRELFDAKKYQYNDMHNIKIGGYDVELYVQDPNQEHHSQGIYSLLKNNWVSVPKRRKPKIDDVSVYSKTEDLAARIDDAVKSNDYQRIADLHKKIKTMRQSGLEQQGEYGSDNLAFKVLRNQGYIKKLIDARNAVRDAELSLQERKKKKKKVRYGLGGYWYPGFGFGSEGDVGGGDGGGGESMHEDNTGMAQGSAIGDAGAQSTWDGVSPDTQEFLSETDQDHEDIVQDFIKDTAEKLGIQRLPQVELHRDPEWSQQNKSFGMYNPELHELHVSLGNRHLLDILRTTAHELAHCAQNQRESLPNDAGNTGSEYENEAHAIAGMIMRDYADAHPELFMRQEIDEGVMSRAGAAAALAAAVAMSPAQAQDYLPQDQPPQVQQQGQLNPIQILNIARTLYRLKHNVTRAGAEEELNQEFKNYIRAQQGDPGAQNQSRVWQLQQRQQQKQQPQQQPWTGNQYQREDIVEASGYIPTDAEKNDPRFVMALSPDVRPGATGKNANKMALRTNAQGQPQLAKTNGLVESLRREFALLEDEYLPEVKMSTANLRQLAAKTGALAGMEFEMIVPNTETDVEPEYEPDYDQDSRARSFSQIRDFFHDNDYNSSRTADRLMEELTVEYEEWVQEQIDESWGDDGIDYIRDFVEVNDLFDVDEAMAQARDEVITANPDLPPESKDFQQLVNARINELQEQFVLEAFEDKGRIYNDAFETFADEQREEYDERTFLDDKYPYMTDIQNNFDISWPYYYDINDGQDGDMDVDQVADEFSSYMGKPVNASRSYHGARREPGHYVVEPDGSLEGDNPGDGGLEFVSPPMPIDEMITDLNKVKAWADKTGCYTNDSTGLHINISVPDYSLEKLDYVKLALLMGDEYVLELFGRSGNTYAKAATDKIRTALKKNPNLAPVMMDKMRDHMEGLATKAIHSGTTDKYTSINTKSGYIEFRSPGGDWLDANFNKIENTLLRFTVALSAAIDPEAYRQEYLKKLYKLLESSQEKGGVDVVQLFSNYSAGELDKAALIRQVREKQLERDLAKGKTLPGQKFWWDVSRPGYFASIEVVASNKEEAIAKAIEPGNYPDWASARNTLRAKPIRPYQGPQAKPAAQPSGPTLNGRPSNPDGNYVIVDSADEQTPVYRYMAANGNDALLVLRQWISANPGTRWNFKFDPTQLMGQPQAQQPAASTDQGNWGIWIINSNRFANQPGSYSRNETPPPRRFPSRDAAEQWVEQQRATRPDMRSDIEVREIEPSAPAQTNTGNWGVFVPMTSWFATVANDTRRFVDRAGAQAWIDDYNQRHPSNDLELEPREIEPARASNSNQTQLSQTDMENRMELPDQTGDANYEIIDRRTGRRVFVMIANTEYDARRKYADWLSAAGYPIETEDYGFREIALPGSTLDLQRQRAAQEPQDVNPLRPTGPGPWEVANRANNQVYYNPPSSNPIEAESQSRTWLRQNGHNEADFEVRTREGVNSDAAQGGIIDVTGDNWSADFERRMQQPTWNIVNTSTGETIGSVTAPDQRSANSAAERFIYQWTQTTGYDEDDDYEVQLAQPATAPRTLTTPGQPQQQFTGEWQVLDPEDREIYRFSGVGNNQSDANRVAMNWLRQNPGRMQAGVTVVPVMG